MYSPDLRAFKTRFPAGTVCAVNAVLPWTESTGFTSCKLTQTVPAGNPQYTCKYSLAMDARGCYRCLSTGIILCFYFFSRDLPARILQYQYYIRGLPTPPHASIIPQPCDTRSPGLRAVLKSFSRCENPPVIRCFLHRMTVSPIRGA